MITERQQAEYAAQANARGKILRRDENGNVALDETGKPYFDDYVRSEEEIVASNQSLIQGLIREATLQINILQDTIDLEMTTNGEAEQLKAWKRYRILLTRVDTSLEEMELPTKPE